VLETDPDNGEKLPRAAVEAAVRQKRECVDDLVNKYSSTTKLSPEDARRVIDSISDAYTVVESNVAPVMRMLELLEETFDPGEFKKPYSLALNGKSRSSFGGYGYGMGNFGFGGGSCSSSSNNGGATLSHTHEQQYTFVWQSLCLWKKIQQNMHRWVRLLCFVGRSGIESAFSFSLSLSLSLSLSRSLARSLFDDISRPRLTINIALFIFWVVVGSGCLLMQISCPPPAVTAYGTLVRV